MEMMFFPISKMKITQTVIHADTWALLFNSYTSDLSGS